MARQEKLQSFAVSLPQELSCYYEDKKKELGQGEMLIKFDFVYKKDLKGNLKKHLALF